MKNILVSPPFEASFDIYPVGPTAGGPRMGWKEDLDNMGMEETLVMPVRLQETVIYSVLSKLCVTGPWALSISSLEFIRQKVRLL